MERMYLDHESVFAPATPTQEKAAAGMERCVSPLSQASTAPPTPSCLSELPRPVFSRTVSDQSDASAQSTKGSEEASIDDLMQLVASPFELEEWDDSELRSGLLFGGRGRTLETEYLIDNSKLKATTIGLAYRCSKRVQDRDHSIHGPCWGTTVMGMDQGDGWLKVGDHFLPMQLEGVSVLAALEPAAAENEAPWDGPSLTAHGCAVDLEDCAMLFFSHAKELSSGYETACRAKEQARLIRAVRMAHSACEAEARLEAGEVCSIDSFGVVRGAAALGPPLAGAGAASARQRFLVRRARAAAAAARACEGRGRPLLCADAGGKVSLYFPSLGTARAEGLRRRRAAAAACQGPQERDTSGVLLVASASGCISGCRRADRPPRVIPARCAPQTVP